jgi:hypothetical protein
MTGSLKTSVLALLAISIVGSAAVPVAQATEGGFTWENGATKIKKEADPDAPTQEFKITPGAITASFICDEVSGEATVTGTGSTSLTMQNIVYSDSGTTPEKEVCTGTVNGIGVKTTVKFNGCDYKLTTNTTVGEKAAGVVEGSVHLECPAGKQVEISAAGCNAKIAPQTAGRVLYTTVITVPSLIEHVTAHFDLGGTEAAHNNAIDYSTTGLTCGTHAETDGIYRGTKMYTAFDDFGNRKSITVT